MARGALSAAIGQKLYVELCLLDCRHLEPLAFLWSIQTGEACSVQYYGQFETPVDQFIHERYFPEEGIDGFFIECGAFDGSIECSCRFFEESLGWKGVNLEPVPWIFDKLKENRPASVNLNVGLSNAEATLPFQAVNHPYYGLQTTIGSLNHGHELKASLEAENCTFKEIQVEVIPWSKLLELESIQHVTLMVLDVEGHELAVLEGMRGSTVLPELMCVEFGHVGFLKLRALMEELGYSYDITSYANAYFIRKDVLALYTARANRSKELVIDDGEAARAEASKLRAQLDGITLGMAEQRGQIEWLRLREEELLKELSTIHNSRGWKALEVAKNVWFWRKRR